MSCRSIAFTWFQQNESWLLVKKTCRPMGSNKHNHIGMPSVYYVFVLLPLLTAVLEEDFNFFVLKAEMAVGLYAPRGVG